MHDAGFKKVFSHPRMIEMLIRRHLPEWAGRIDYLTLEKLPTELIADKLVKRYPDMVWRARFTGKEADFLLLLEFQDRPDRHMAFRTSVYSSLAAKDFLEHEKA